MASLRRDSIKDRRRSVSVFGYNRQPVSPPPNEDRRIYSPVMFEDVAMHSITNSPVRTMYTVQRGRDSRSNSTGHVFMHSPSELFGSLINDTEEFFEDLSYHRGKVESANNLQSSLSTPAFSPRRIPRALSSSSGKTIPPSTAPPAIMNSPSNSHAHGQFTERELVEYSRPSTSAMVQPTMIDLNKQSNLTLAIVNQRSNDSVNK